MFIAIALAYLFALQGFVAAATHGTHAGLFAPSQSVGFVICDHDRADHGPSDKHDGDDPNGSCCAGMACCSGVLALGVFDGFTIRRAAVPCSHARSLADRIAVPTPSSRGFSARAPPVPV